MSTLHQLLAHDIKNALGILEGELLQLRTQAPAWPAPAAEAITQAHRHCTALRQRLVGYLLLAPLDQGGTLTAHRNDECPVELLESLIARADECVPAGIEVVLGDISQAPAWCWIDRRLVRLALEAALHNAGRFARQRVVLSAAAHAGGVRFTVQDDGPGPGAPESAEGDSNTGLGSALAQAVAQAHGGGYAALRKGPEGGACFELCLL